MYHVDYRTSASPGQDHQQQAGLGHAPSVSPRLALVVGVHEEAEDIDADEVDVESIPEYLSNDFPHDLNDHNFFGHIDSSTRLIICFALLPVLFCPSCCSADLGNAIIQQQMARLTQRQIGRLLSAALLRWFMS